MSFRNHLTYCFWAAFPSDCGVLSHIHADQYLAKDYKRSFCRSFARSSSLCAFPICPMFMPPNFSLSASPYSVFLIFIKGSFRSFALFDSSFLCWGLEILLAASQGLPCLFFYSWDHCYILSVVQYLKTFVSHIFSRFLVDYNTRMKEKTNTFLPFTIFSQHRTLHLWSPRCFFLQTLCSSSVDTNRVSHNSIQFMMSDLTGWGLSPTRLPSLEITM